ncbi:hypothetical protein [Methanococcoides burtonii]|uniref:Uncharacterized protein n=1 Tax=Methanococcoides burtonii (strain DSM 6242 / NBRC 107633 / OCM 468 / ACE-M) TaxID=259564 RepID=Q12YE0_METBU|nr:hypothetical protein [Methanococcoides burtonii]ABE51536.1 Hypothetical protein Mbur_0561 [Methanococcoides burtonii DSM 6242]
MNLNINTDKNNYNSYKNTNEFEYNVISILQSTPFIRKRDLIKKLQTNFQENRGYSHENIQRKLYDMQGAGTLLVIRYEDLQKYGIKEEDKRSTYVTLRRTGKITSHLDVAINKLQSNNPIKQKMALKEIESYEKHYALNPKQLDMLVSILKSDDTNLLDHVLRIVYNYIEYKKIDPSNETKTIDVLRSLLKKYPEPLRTHTNLRSHLIFLLGYYNDSAVVERAIRDAETLDNLHEIKEEYQLGTAANIIEEHREELYEFEEKLRLENKIEAAQFIAEIRATALIDLGLKDDPFKNKDNNELEMDTLKSQMFLSNDEKKERILNISEKEADRLGVPKKMLDKIQWKIRNGDKINWKAKNVCKLLKQDLKESDF